MNTYLIQQARFCFIFFLFCLQVLRTNGVLLPCPEKKEQNRRSFLRFITASTPSAVFLPQFSVWADDATYNDFKVYESSLYSLSLPSSWKVITNTDTTNDKKQQQQRKDGLLFSAIDFGTGSVATVYRERACDLATYVKDSKNCDLVLPKDNSGNNTPLFGEATLSKDIQKLLIRYDERDNKVLDGTTSLVDYNVATNSHRRIFLTGATVIPTGGTYRDGMGLDQPKTLTRIVKASIMVLVEDETISVLSAWISAPEDEWKKPVSGIRLRNVVESVQLFPSQL